MRMCTIAIGEDIECCDRAEFSSKFGFIVNHSPTHLSTRKACECVKHFEEELNELKGAIGEQDLAEMADALVDLVYLIKGMAIMMGLPWQDLWMDVHRANMSKERGIRPKRMQAVDVVKPEGWVGPQTLQILESYGYVRGNFFDDEGKFIEAKGADDSLYQPAPIQPLKEDIDV